MATKITAGQIYKAKGVKSGTSSRGDWMMTHVADERGRNEITLFITNLPCNLAENQQFKVKCIDEVVLGVRRNKNPEKAEWYPSYTVNVQVEPIASEFPDLDMESDPWGDAGGALPWKEEDELPL